MPGYGSTPFVHLQHLLLILITLRIVESVQIFHYDPDDLISEQLLCPRLQSGQFQAENVWIRPYGHTAETSYIILEMDPSPKCQGPCTLPPCKFNVRTSSYISSNPVDSTRPHPSKGELIGAFRSRFRWFPIPIYKGKNAHYTHRFSACWNNFIQFKLDHLKEASSSEEICQVPARINPITPSGLVYLSRDPETKWQAILWNVLDKDTFSKTLALSFNNENATVIPSDPGDGKSQLENAGFIHLIFMFNSTKGGCYIRVEHYEIFPQNANDCTTTPTDCNFLHCDKLHLLEYKVRKFWRWEKQLDTVNPFTEDNIDMGLYWNMDTSIDPRLANLWLKFQKINDERFQNFNGSYNSKHNYGLGESTFTLKNYDTTKIRRTETDGTSLGALIFLCIAYVSLQACYRSFGEGSDEDSHYEEGHHIPIPHSVILNPIVPPQQDQDLNSQCPAIDIMRQSLINMSIDLQTDIRDILEARPTSPPCLADDAPPAYDSVKLDMDQLPSYVEAVGVKKSMNQHFDLP